MLVIYSYIDALRQRRVVSTKTTRPAKPPIYSPALYRKHVQSPSFGHCLLGGVCPFPSPRSPKNTFGTRFAPSPRTTAEIPPLYWPLCLPQQEGSDGVLCKPGLLESESAPATQAAAPGSIWLPHTAPISGVLFSFPRLLPHFPIRRNTAKSPGGVRVSS